ncbi:MAG: hypothetical protein ACREPA_07035, partial [Candidatus Dormibacteraceae bacterium]
MAEAGVGLYLAGVVVAGYGLTMLGGPMAVEERLFFGAVIGAMAATLASFLAALLIGLGPPAVLGGLGVALAGAGAGLLLKGRRGIIAELGEARSRWWRDPRAPCHPWPLAALLAVCWAFSLRLLWQAYRTGPNGLVAGYVNIWGDWAAHLTYAGSFAFGHNLPPQFPIDPGHHLSYPFMVDYMAAGLVPLGASLTASLVWTSGLLGLAFPGVMYLAGRRLLGGRAAPALAVLIFALSGGLGFVRWFGDLRRLGWAALTQIPRQYTLDPTLNYKWLNPVLAYLVPQRDILFGLAVVLIAATLLWSARTGEGHRRHVFAGVLVGLTPLFHVHGYGTAVALFGFWALIERRRAWIGFFIPALGLGIPALAWLLPGVNADLRWQPGWMAGADGHHQSWVWFWIQNTGLLIPLLLVATCRPALARLPFRRLPRRLRRVLPLATGACAERTLPAGLGLRLAPLWLWFIVPNLAVFQPWDWDNTKFFVFWLLFASMAVAALLVRLFESRGARPWGPVVAAACCVVLGLAGTLDLGRAVDY